MPAAVPAAGAVLWRADPGPELGAGTAPRTAGINEEDGMGTNRGATAAKRARERARQERQKEKAERRAQRRADKGDRQPGSTDEDPDIAGIIPGPQPRFEDE